MSSLRKAVLPEIMQEALYDELYNTEEIYWWFRARRSIIHSLIRRYHKGPEPSILDIGCGAGYNLKYLSGHFSDVKGLDSSDRALSFCRERGVQALKGSLPDEVPFEAGSLDIVLMMDVLEHIEDDRGAVEAVWRLLKDSGLFIITVPAHRFLWTSHDELHSHKRRYETCEIRKLFEGLPFDKVLLSQFNTLLSPPIVASRLFAGKRRCRSEKAGINLLPGPINRLLESIFAAEKHVIPYIPLPFGISIIAVYRKKRL